MIFWDEHHEMKHDPWGRTPLYAVRLFCFHPVQSAYVKLFILLTKTKLNLMLDKMSMVSIFQVPCENKICWKIFQHTWVEH